MLFLHSLKSHAPLIAIMMPLLVLAADDAAAHDARRAIHETRVIRQTVQLGLGMAAAASLDVQFPDITSNVQEQKEDNMPDLVSDEPDFPSDPRPNHKRRRSRETDKKQQRSNKEMKRRKAEEQAAAALSLDPFLLDIPVNLMTKAERKARTKALKARKREAGGRDPKNQARKFQKKDNRSRGKSSAKTRNKKRAALRKGLDKAIRKWGGIYTGERDIVYLESSGHDHYRIDGVYFENSISGSHRDSNYGWLLTRLREGIRKIAEYRAELERQGHTGHHVTVHSLKTMDHDDFMVNGERSRVTKGDYKTAVSQLFGTPKSMEEKSYSSMRRLLAMAES